MSTLEKQYIHCKVTRWCKECTYCTHKAGMMRYCDLFLLVNNNHPSDYKTFEEFKKAILKAKLGNL